MLFDSLLASCSLGAAQASLEQTIKYTSERHQFGKPIISFQVCQSLFRLFYVVQWTEFKLAEMATKVVTSRLMIRAAAMALQNKQPETVAYCSMAKLHGTEACFEVSYFSAYSFLHYIAGCQSSITNARWIWCVDRLSNPTISA